MLLNINWMGHNKRGCRDWAVNFFFVVQCFRLIINRCSVLTHSYKILWSFQIGPGCSLGLLLWYWGEPSIFSGQFWDFVPNCLTPQHSPSLPGIWTQKKVTLFCILGPKSQNSPKKWWLRLWWVKKSENTSIARKGGGGWWVQTLPRFFCGFDIVHRDQYGVTMDPQKWLLNRHPPK